MSVPMPADLRIVPPGPDVPPDLARFSGAWGNGAWGGIGPVALAVERVGPDGSAEVVYAFGACEQFGFEAHWSRARGRVADGRLRLDQGAGFLTEFAPGDGGVLVGRFVPPQGYQARVWLDRVPGRTAAMVAATLALPRRPPWEELRVPVRSAVGATAGQVLQLQAFHYPTRLPGRQPLVVLNHGSTDGEAPGVRCIHPFEPEARFFLGRGCSGLALMRKGRGHSDGPVLEEAGGVESEDAQLDSAVEDLHAAVAFMGDQSHVDAARVVVGGQSRGGLLSVAYAGRHPRQVAAVVTFAGGWWGEGWDRNGFNRRQAALAGSGATAPMLWLYGARILLRPAVRGRDVGGVPRGRRPGRAADRRRPARRRSSVDDMAGPVGDRRGRRRGRPGRRGTCQDIGHGLRGWTGPWRNARPAVRG